MQPLSKTEKPPKDPANTNTASPLAAASVSQTSQTTQPLQTSQVSAPSQAPQTSQLTSPNSLTTQSSPQLTSQTSLSFSREPKDAPQKELSNEASNEASDSDKSLSTSKSAPESAGLAENQADHDDAKEKKLEKHFFCRICKQGFTRKHNMVSHELIHLSNKPHVCSVCDATFRRIHDLRRHEKLHLGEKPFHCQHCNRGFARTDALTRHINSSNACSGKAKADKEEDKPNIESRSSVPVRPVGSVSSSADSVFSSQVPVESHELSSPNVVSGSSSDESRGSLGKRVAYDLRWGAMRLRPPLGPNVQSAGNSDTSALSGNMQNPAISLRGIMNLNPTPVEQPKVSTEHHHHHVYHHHHHDGSVTTQDSLGLSRSSGSSESGKRLELKRHNEYFPTDVRHRKNPEQPTSGQNFLQQSRHPQMKFPQHQLPHQPPPQYNMQGPTVGRPVQGQYQMPTQIMDGQVWFQQESDGSVRVFSQKNIPESQSNQQGYVPMSTYQELVHYTHSLQNSLSTMEGRISALENEGQRRESQTEQDAAGTASSKQQH